ncbi:hypothetical protein [Rhodococcus qingshengii]|uniref:hypothetical protein n=1 Tax=Rhodococcus qingshengii TaxID=334542 RepID=UPI00279B29D4|nr:hypothetical protein PI247_31230 [Rhodococcus qingshengii]
MTGTSPETVIAGAILAMQLRSDMPRTYCRTSTHGPLTQLVTPTSGGLALKCSTCGASSPVTEDQIRIALGAAALPAPKDIGLDFGIAVPETSVGSAPLARSEQRFEFQSGASIPLSTVLGIIGALFTAGLALQRMPFFVGLLLATAVGVTVTAVLRRRHTRRNRGRAAWLPGDHVQVADLFPGTWISTPSPSATTRCPPRRKTPPGSAASTESPNPPRPVTSNSHSATAAFTPFRDEPQFEPFT